MFLKKTNEFIIATAVVEVSNPHRQIKTVVILEYMSTACTSTL